MARHIRPAGNIVGRQVRKIRANQGLSQPQLAAKCQRIGWDIGRDIIARIEAGVRLVTDSELLFLARALNIEVASLLPKTKMR
jgi:transcriptional regulator with XRE-family HTH domain